MVSSKTNQDRRERARVARERQRKADRRRQWMITGGAVTAVVVIVVAFVVINLVSGKSKQKDVTAAAPPSVTSSLAALSAASFQQAGTSARVNGLKAIKDTPLTAGGKPEVLYVGGEFCPYCAAERWPLAAALQRFGTLSGLQTTKSSGNDVFPNTATLSFVQTKYTSKYLTFTPVEAKDRNGAPLQPLSAAQNALAQKYSGGGIPFLDLGNKFVASSQYDPAVLKGLSAEQIAQQINDPSTDVGKSVLASANILTAGMCVLTGDQPATVCTSPEVKAAAAKLGSGGTSGSS